MHFSINIFLLPSKQEDVFHALLQMLLMHVNVHPLADRLSDLKGC